MKEILVDIGLYLLLGTGFMAVFLITEKIVDKLPEGNKFKAWWRKHAVDEEEK